MRKNTIILVVLFALLFVAPALAQGDSEPLDLRLTRDWGYGGLNGEIQGKFSLRVTGPDVIVRVDFIVDGVVVNTDTEPPFRYQFDTGEYPPGEHTLTAIGYDADGLPYAGKTYRRTFLSAEEAGAKTMAVLAPLLVFTGLLMAAGIAVSLFAIRRQGFRLGEYGMAGGAVCPRCGFPYTRHMLSPNMLVGKLERCPHCGKWAIVPAASQSALREAELRWQQEGSSEAAPLSDEEQRRQMLEDSRFE